MEESNIPNPPAGWTKSAWSAYLDGYRKNQEHRNFIGPSPKPESLEEFFAKMRETERKNTFFGQSFSSMVDEAFSHIAAGIAVIFVVWIFVLATAAAVILATAPLWGLWVIFR